MPSRCLAAAIATILFTAPSLADPTPAEIETVARSAYEAMPVPGMSVVVMQDGEIVYSGGFGVRDLETGAPVDGDTIFQLASVSKAFTAAALAILVDEGRIGWDDPVVRYLPEFAMSDPWLTANFTIRDLLTHRSGLPLGAGDLLHWPDGDASRSEVIAAMRYLPVETGFRTSFAYDNLLYIVAGEVVPAVSGLAWEDFVEQRLLQPMGMTDCRAIPDRVPAGANRAMPYSSLGGELVRVDFDPAEPSAAAGSVNCSGNAMMRWANVLLNDGRLPDGTQLISEAQVAQLVRPVTLMRPQRFERENGLTHMIAYALGWTVSDFAGEMLWEHSGGSTGGVTNFALLPDRNVAVVVLVNDTSTLAMAVTRAILLAYAVPDSSIDVTGYYAGQMQQWHAAEAEDRTDVVAEAGAPPAHALSAYTGTYRDPWYGTVTVSLREGGLWMDMSRSRLLDGPLLPHEGETFVAHWIGAGIDADAYVEFLPGDEGRPTRIRMRRVSDYADFSYDFHHLDLQRVQ